MKPVDTVLMAMGQVLGQDLASPHYYPKTKPVKYCLYCTTAHTHNNSFCSAACCKAYKIQKRNELEQEEVSKYE